MPSPNILIPSSAARNVFIVAAKRTPFGAFGGAFKSLTATDLGVTATQAALDDLKIENAASHISEVYFGNVLPSSPDAAYLARHVGLRVNMPISSPALTINRLCGSGFETLIQAYKAIQVGAGSSSKNALYLAGGTEHMSNAPLVVYGSQVRWGIPLGQGFGARDLLWDGLTDSFAENTPMGMTAENLAVQYEISRQECDEYAIRSQQMWQKAKQDGVFDAEMAPVSIKTRKGETIIDTDEHPRPQSTLEQISKLKPVFKKDGTVTAANASGICDGAGAVLLASEEACLENNWTPLCRLGGWAVAGCDPKTMGIGPVPAVRQLLATTGIAQEDVDRFEFNEAFAAQVLACAKELNLDMSKTNLHGGAISLGHPLGASGSRITAHLAHEFARKPENKIHVGAACIGGGQGIAVMLERV
jgi:acetyl-CoA acyltransferase 2